MIFDKLKKIRFCFLQIDLQILFYKEVKIVCHFIEFKEVVSEVIADNICIFITGHYECESQSIAKHLIVAL